MFVPLIAFVGVFCTATAARGQKDPNKLKFYVYDFPGESLGWMGDQKWLKTSVYYGGYGKPINEEKGMFQTNQYSLYKIMLKRALTDPRRTDNPYEASAFFIPYDMGYDAAIRLDKGIWPHHCALSTDIEARLNRSSFFRRNKGKDHILVFSINWGMNYFITPPCTRFLGQVCQNCIKMCIDDYSFLFGGQFESISPYQNLVRDRGINWRAVPFPSDMHWNSKMTRPYPWESDHERPFLVGYGGSTESYSRVVARLRKAIAAQCDEVPDLCHRNSYGKGRDFVYSAQGNETTIHDIFNTSIFCLNPPGDLPTRKGLFDSILMGCIPVTFNPLSATAMYTWHWPEEYWKSVAVEIDEKTRKSREFNVVRYLQNISKDEITSRQNLLRARAYELQYSYVEPLQHTRPGKDAFDIAMDEAMSFGAGLSDGVRRASIPSCGFKCNT